MTYTYILLIHFLTTSQWVASLFQSCTKYSVMNAEIRQINYERLTLLNSTTFHIVFITVTRKRRYWKEPRKVSIKIAYLPTEIRTRSLPRVKYKCSTLHHDAETEHVLWTCQKTKHDRQCNTELRSRNHCCRGNAISIKLHILYPPCNAHAPSYIVIRDLPGSTTFFHITSQKARSLGKKLLNT
jgi:hypothetical protein